MALINLLSVVIFLVLATATPSLSEGVQPSKRLTCIPQQLSSRNSSADDAPAIQQTFKSCGRGGLIIIPANTTYNIRTPLHFNGCNGCEMQIEGTLKAADNAGNNAAYWRSQPGVIDLTNINDAAITSISGKGVIDGGNPMWPPNQSELSPPDAGKGIDGPLPLLVNIASSTNISISNLSLKDPLSHFINVDGSSDINISSLDFTANWTPQQDYHGWIALAGIDIRNTTRMIVDTLTINKVLGYCVTLKAGSSNITVRNVICSTGGAGVTVNMEDSLDFDDTVSNALMTDLTITDGIDATGIISTGANRHLTVSNVTWDGVDAANTLNAITIRNCTGGTSFCMEVKDYVNYDGVHFLNYRGARSPLYSTYNCTAKDSCNVTYTNISVGTA